MLDVNVNPAALHLKNALVLCQYAKDVYKKYNAAVDKTQWLFEENADHQVLSFAGTKDFKDWITDGMFVKVKRADMGEIHDGFADAFDLAREKVQAAVKPGKPIYLSGHSLGGALATIFALFLKQNGCQVACNVTFGGPRVGNKEWYNLYSAAKIPTFRFVNSCDIVPTVPDIGYDHVGESVYMSAAGKRLSSQESAYTWKFWTITKRRFAAHAVQGYVDTLAKLAGA